MMHVNSSEIIGQAEAKYLKWGAAANLWWNKQTNSSDSLSD
jgi:hypothetical protein